jgi:hypothetical protein
MGSDGMDPTTKHLERLRNGAVGWINSADAKAVAILTVGGALLALLAAVLAGVAATSMGAAVSKLELQLFIAFCVSDLISIALAAWAIFPRTNRARILQRA